MECNSESLLLLDANVSLIALGSACSELGHNEWQKINVKISSYNESPNAISIILLYSLQPGPSVPDHTQRFSDLMKSLH